MYIKHLIIIVSTIMSVSSEMRAIEEMYLNFFTQIESVKKSIDILKVRMDILSERNPSIDCCSIDNKFSSKVFENFDAVKKSLNDLNIRMDGKTDKPHDLENKMENFELQQKILAKELAEVKENYLALSVELKVIKNSEESLRQRNADLEKNYNEILKNYENIKMANNDLKLQVDSLTKQLSNINAKEEAIENYHKKPLFDVRVDKLPEFKKYCHEDPTPVDCKTATKCTQKSGYYKIFLPDNKTKQIMVFCDMETNGGGWLHILRRMNGSLNFTRPWQDYVNGFGNVEGEYWLGLENINVLTNKNGQQQLYVYIEDFNGQTYFALYNNFIVGNANELFELKSLGKYYGMGEDDMSHNVGSKFSTIDNDNDQWTTGSCAIERQTGWWYNHCTFVQPTGHYLYGESSRNAMLWRSFNGLKYSHKTMYLMIRN